MLYEFINLLAELLIYLQLFEFNVTISVGQWILVEETNLPLDSFN